MANTPSSPLSSAFRPLLRARPSTIALLYYCSWSGPARDMALDAVAKRTPEGKTWSKMTKGERKHAVLSLSGDLLAILEAQRGDLSSHPHFRRFRMHQRGRSLQLHLVAEALLRLGQVPEGVDLPLQLDFKPWVDAGAPEDYEEAFEHDTEDRRGDE